MLAVEHVRQEWEDANRRLEVAARDRAGYERLLEQVDAVTSELRRRVGQVFTLQELAAAYSGAERWSREAIAEHAPHAGWARTLTIAEGAAFHLYARGASDYRP